ncbi:MAG: DUF305 domain-containing protein [Gordonia polyisoprenivorans]|nr:DUF305 domain-containing protein [Gordonia polyisoprenivorans]
MALFSSRRVIVGAATVATAVGVTVGGCSADSSSPSSASSSVAEHGTAHGALSSAVRSDFVAADVTFLTDMYPHHAQAIDMAKLAAGRSQNAQLLTLATAIEKAQGPEMSQISDLLRSFGKPAPVAEGHHSSMSGMMSDDQMTSLANLSGAAFDRQWLEMMIDHHTGAVAMANSELANGSNAEARKLARAIVSDQQNEIGQMKAMLAGR